MELTKEQIIKLAIYAGCEVKDVTGTDLSTEYKIEYGNICGSTDQKEYSGLLAYNKSTKGAIALN